MTIEIVDFPMKKCDFPVRYVSLPEGTNLMLKKPREKKKLDDGWPESEKNVFQAALRMVVVKDSR